MIGRTWQARGHHEVQHAIGLAYVEYGRFVNLTFAFTGAGEMIKTYQYSPPNPNEQPSVFTYTLSGDSEAADEAMGIQSYQ
ncbi:MAG: hypothetical protein IPJ14_23605 [Kineosporiaceae bacterium]|nr:hypothetical protein [Kineosporiaceae bacterium]